MVDNMPNSDDIARFVMGVEPRDDSDSNSQTQPNTTTEENTTTSSDNNNQEMTTEELRKRRLEKLQGNMPPPKIEEQKASSSTQDNNGTPIRERSKNLHINLNKDKMVDDDNAGSSGMGPSPNMFGFQQTPRNEHSGTAFSPSPITPTKRKKMDPYLRYQHECISTMFKVVINSTVEKYMTLPGELLSGNHFSLEEMDSFFLEYLRALYQDRLHPFYHLIKVHARLEREYGSVKSRKSFKKEPTKEQRMHVLDTLRGIVVNYANLLLTNPEVFLQNDQESKLSPYKLLLEGLLKDTSSDMYVPLTFLNKLINEQATDDALFTMMNQFFFSYYDYAAKCTLNEPFRMKLLLILIHLFDKKNFDTKIAAIFVDHPLFLHDSIQNGKELERKTILGQLFKLHGCEKSVIRDSFGDIKITNINRDDMRSRKQYLRQSHADVQTRLIDICKKLAGPSKLRPKMVKWFAKVVELNDGRTKMIDRGTCASEGFLANFMAVTLMLAKPVVKKHTYTEVDPTYPMQSPEMDCLKEGAKIGATIPVARDFFVGKEVPDYPFKTQITFFALRAVVMGYAKSMEHYLEILQRLEETTQGENARDPEVLREAEIFLHHRWAFESFLYDETLVFELFGLLEYLAKYLLFQAGYKGDIQLADDIPMHFAALPEEFLELIPKILIFMGRANPNLLRNQKMDTFLELMIIFLNNSKYINNPYVLAKFPEAFAIFVPTERNTSNRHLLDNAISQKHLMFGIMKLYVDIGHTDSSNAFFQKFSPRFYMAQTIRGVWPVQAFKKQFKDLSLTITSSEDRIFLKFFNTIITDAIYLLDESLKILISIHEFEHKANTMNPREREQEEQALNTQQLKSSLLLARETLLMMELLTKDVPEPFKDVVMIDRVAAMMNYFLSTLAGKKCQTLKVKNPQQYHFNPRELLVTLISTYFNLTSSDPEPFYKAIFADKRSFDVDTFSVRVPNILTKIANSDPRISSYPDRWRAIVHHITTVTSIDEDDFDDDDIPDEFEDAIMYELMRDPVKLPDGSVVDRRTIEVHLLSSNQNPFTNQPMTMNDVVPLPDLKAKIEAWLVERRQLRLKEQQQA